MYSPGSTPSSSNRQRLLNNSGATAKVVAIKNVNSERERLRHQRGNSAAIDDDDEDSDANAGFGCAGNAFGYQTLNNREAKMKKDFQDDFLSQSYITLRISFTWHISSLL